MLTAASTEPSLNELGRSCRGSLGGVEGGAIRQHAVQDHGKRCLELPTQTPVSHHQFEG